MDAERANAKKAGDQTKGGALKILAGILLLVLATLACESDTTLSITEVTPTPKPTLEPTPENMDPNYAPSFPLKVKNSSGWTFTIHRIELLRSLDTPDQHYLPARGLYLWLVGAVGNFTTKHDCIRGQEFSLRNGSARYKMSVEHAEATHEIYNLSYPDFFIGNCLDAAESAESFLIFDVPREAGTLWLELGDSQVQLGRMSTLIQAMPPSQPSPDPEVQGKPRPLVTADRTNVNIRSGPGTHYAVIGKLLAGQSFEISGRNVDSSWWQISTPNGFGWVAAKYTTASNTDDRIPIVEPHR